MFDLTGRVALVTGAGRGIGAGIDILVNNAGGTPNQTMPAPFRDTPPETWASFINMNLNGVLNCTRAVIDGMVGREFGRNGVTANAVALGLVDTVPEEFLQGRDMGRSYAVGRIGTAEES